METHDERFQMIGKLNTILEREFHSLATYLNECDPWIPEAHRDWIKGELREIAAQSRRHAEEIVDIISQLEGSAALGNYTRQIVDMSYLSIQYSLSRAIDWMTDLIHRYDEFMTQYKAWDDVCERLKILRDEVKTQRARLQEAVDRLNTPGTPVPEA